MQTLQCNTVNACLFSKHFMDYETPHPTSSLGHLLPRGEGKGTACPLPWGEGVGHAPTGEGSLWLRPSGRSALLPLAHDAITHDPSCRELLPQSVEGVKD